MPGESNAGYIYLGNKYLGDAPVGIDGGSLGVTLSSAPHRFPTTAGAGAGARTAVGPLPPPPLLAMQPTALETLRRTRAMRSTMPPAPPRPPTTTYADTFTGGGVTMTHDVPASSSTSSSSSGAYSGSQSARSATGTSTRAGGFIGGASGIALHPSRHRDYSISNRAPHTYSTRVVREVAEAAAAAEARAAARAAGEGELAEHDPRSSSGSLAATAPSGSLSARSSSSTSFSTSTPIVGIPSVVRLDTNFPTAPQHTGLDPDDRNLPHMPRSQAWSSGPTFRFFKRYSAPPTMDRVRTATGDTYYRPASIEAERRITRGQAQRRKAKEARRGEW